MLDRLYRYVGPLRIAEAITAERGIPIDGDPALSKAIRALAPGARDAVTFTFVVDGQAVLRLADRASEHVACAGGGPVMAAGELTVEDGHVVAASNQSTGYCPEPDSERALRASLEASRLRHDLVWTAFEFRRCPTCGVTTLVKDGELCCAECDGPLPQRWNFERTRCARAFAQVAGERWTIDVIEEPGSRDEDRIAVVADGDRITIGLADGAGGRSGGRAAATAVCDAVSSSNPQSRDDAIRLLARVDATLASRASGETTAVVAMLDARGLQGVSVGDSEAHALVGGRWADLTEHQVRKPFLGSGCARTTAFGPSRADSVLIASDGLFKYCAMDRVEMLLGSGDPLAPWRLADLVRLPSGSLQDDFAAVLLRRA